jgi:ATP-dependent DNA ligase
VDHRFTYHREVVFEQDQIGFRVLLGIDAAGARLVSRDRNRFKHLHKLAPALANRLRIEDAILDGEIICADETGAGRRSWPP